MLEQNTKFNVWTKNIKVIFSKKLKIACEIRGKNILSFKYKYLYIN
jgi:hypothetical protein